MTWTSKPPTEDGYYLWRVCYPGGPPTMEPFMIYMLADTMRVIELSSEREHINNGAWTYSEWLYRTQRESEDAPYPVQYRYIGPSGMNLAFIEAFRELYHASVSVQRDLLQMHDLTEYSKSVTNELTMAIYKIHEKDK